MSARFLFSLMAFFGCVFSSLSQEEPYLKALETLQFENDHYFYVPIIRPEASELGLSFTRPSYHLEKNFTLGAFVPKENPPALPKFTPDSSESAYFNSAQKSIHDNNSKMLHVQSLIEQMSQNISNLLELGQKDKGQKESLLPIPEQGRIKELEKGSADLGAFTSCLESKESSISLGIYLESKGLRYEQDKFEAHLAESLHFGAEVGNGMLCNHHLGALSLKVSSWRERATIARAFLTARSAQHRTALLEAIALLRSRESSPHKNLWRYVWLRLSLLKPNEGVPSAKILEEELESVFPEKQAVEVPGNMRVMIVESESPIEIFRADLNRIARWL